MAKTYIYPEDVKSLLIFEIGGKEVFIAPMVQQDIRNAFSIYKSVDVAARMINLLQGRSGDELITSEMVKAVLERPLVQMQVPEDAGNDHEAIELQEMVAQAAAHKAAKAQVPHDEVNAEPKPHVVEDEETFDLWGQPLHIARSLQQDIHCAYRILGTAEAAALGLNRVQQLNGHKAVTVDMVQAVITRSLKQDNSSAKA